MGYRAAAHGKYVVWRRRDDGLGLKSLAAKVPRKEKKKVKKKQKKMTNSHRSRGPASSYRQTYTHMQVGTHTHMQTHGGKEREREREGGEIRGWDLFPRWPWDWEEKLIKRS